MQTDARTGPLQFGCQRKDRARRIFPIERIHSRACTGICEQHKWRNEDNQYVVGQNEMLLAFPVFSDSTGSGSVCSSWLELRICFRRNPPESNLLNLDNHGLGISRRGVKNKMFCAHVTSHESELTTVSHKAIGRQRQRSIQELLCVLALLSSHRALRCNEMHQNQPEVE